METTNNLISSGTNYLVEKLNLLLNKKLKRELSKKSKRRIYSSYKDPDYSEGNKFIKDLVDTYYYDEDDVPRRKNSKRSTMREPWYQK